MRNRKINIDPSPVPPTGRGPRLFLLLLGATVAFGIGSAISNRWICDDAFISYRYAQNLVDGKGLVYNAGERVEGYTNFLWTLWCAVPIQLGIRCEDWTIAWGIVAYAVALLLLGWLTTCVTPPASRPVALIPFAAILGATHAEWAIFATSGLETSLFTTLSLLGFILWARGELRSRPHPIAIGFVMTLAAMTRPDGLLFAAVLGFGMLASGWPKWKPALLYGLAFGIPQAAHFCWRMSYYGDVFPNTYYAKSGDLAWWSQGWTYLVLYFQKYAVCAACIPAFFLCLKQRGAANGAADRSTRRIAAVAFAMAIAYTLYVARVGGDFMFARMLIPATPYYLILIELGLLRVPITKIWPLCAIAALLVACMVLPPRPTMQLDSPTGVVDEHAFYGTYLLDESKDRRSPILRKYFSDLPVRVAFLGAEAHVMHRGRIATAIESEAGLTDRFIAHQTLPVRGRVGHEKNAPVDYLVRTRRTHFIFHDSALTTLKLQEHIPLIQMSLDGMPGFVLSWDPVIIAEIRRRGATVEDLPSIIDQLIATMPTATDAEVADLYAKLRLMYFEQNSDPRRENPFIERLKKTPNHHQATTATAGEGRG